jgi:hypothetical protein
MAATPFELSVVPAKGYVAVTPADGTGVQWATGPIRGFIVAVTGTVAVVGLDGSTATLPAIAAGAVYQCAAIRILSTGTTATGIVGLY